MSPLFRSHRSRYAHRSCRYWPVTLLLVVMACSREGEGEEELPPPRPVNAAVSANTPEATLAGLDILSRGGNAIDAAVAVSLVLGVTEPSQSGLGGSVVMLIVPGEGGEGIVVHPGAASAVDSGAASAGDSATYSAPTALRVLHHAWSRHGSGQVTWAELFEPAIRAASEGHSLGRFSHRTIVKTYDRIIADRGATQLLLAPDRAIPAEASLRINPDLAVLLEQVATHGPDAFYLGEVGQRISAALTHKQLPLTSVQLAEAPAAVESAALRASYRGRTLWTVPEPYGGPHLVEALRFLELAPGPWVKAQGWARTAWLAEALAFAWGGGGAHPVQHIASIPPLPAPQDSVGWVPPPAVAESAAAQPAQPSGRDSTRANGAEAAPGADSVSRVRRSPPGEGAGATTHFSIVDASGTAVSVTQTLGGSFGSGLVDGMGFFNQVQDQTRDPGLLAPAIVANEAQIELVLGSPGGERGIAAVLQVIVRALDLEEPLKDAVMAPRLYLSRPLGQDRGRLFLEGVVWEDSLSVRSTAYGPWGDSLDVAARARGFIVGESQSGVLPDGLDAWFGGVNAIAWTGTEWDAIGDERRDGVGGLLVRGAPTLKGALGTVSAPRPAPGG